MYADTPIEDLIEEYLMGRLDEPALLDFNSKMAADPALREEVELQRSIYHSIQQAGREQWKEKLQNIHGSISSPEKETRRNKFNYKKLFWVAAACTTLAISTILILHRGSSPANQIFASVFVPFPPLQGSTRTPLQNTLTQWEQALKLYEQRNYAQSILHFEQVPATEREETYLFYLGNAYLADDQAALAEKAFKAYLSAGGRLAEDAHWYLCLSYLQQHKMAAATAGFNELAKNSSSYGKKAADVLAQLRQEKDE